MRHPGLSTFLAGTAAVTALSLVNSQNITESCQTIRKFVAKKRALPSRQQCISHCDLFVSDHAAEYLCSPSRRSFSVLCRLLEDTGLDEALLEPELTRKW
jgi:hypothetical protein